MNSFAKTPRLSSLRLCQFQAYTNYIVHCSRIGIPNLHVISDPASDKQSTSISWAEAVHASYRVIATSSIPHGSGGKLYR